MIDSELNYFDLLSTQGTSHHDALKVMSQSGIIGFEIREGCAKIPISRRSYFKVLYWIGTLEVGKRTV